MATTKMTERASIVLTAEEKRAARFVAFVRGASVSGVLREMLPAELVKEYNRLIDALWLTDRDIDDRLEALDESNETP